MPWGEHSEKRLLEALVEFAEREVRLLEIIVAELLPPFATSAIIGGLMPLTVGGTTTATLSFVDNNGVAQPAPKGDGSGLVVTFQSTTPSIASVGASTTGTDSLGNTTYVATVTGVAAGDYGLSATVENTSGVALVDDDGTTAFIQPPSASGTVTAPTTNQATTAVITIA
jgi:hypothetical protein